MQGLNDGISQARLRIRGLFSQYRQLAIMISPCLQCLPVTIMLCMLMFSQLAQSHIIEIIPKSQCQKGELQCRTLDWYNQNSNGPFMTSNTEVRFLKGTHILSTSFMEVRNCRNLTIIGMGQVSYDVVDGMPQPTAWINCTGSISSGIVFFNSTDIHLENIGLGSCGKTILSSCNNEFIAALIFQQGSNISLHRVVIDNTHGVGLHIENVFSSVSIENSAFMGAGLYSRKKQSSHSTGHQLFRNVRLQYGRNNCSKQYFEESTIVTINASWFMDGSTNTRGLEVSVHCPNMHVLINDVIIGNNSGGNLQINTTDFGDGFQSSIKLNNCCIYGGRGALGSGMEFLSRIQDQKSENSSCAHSHHILTIYNSTFVSNYAGTNNSAISLRSSNERCNCIAMKIEFISCFFTHNHGIGSIFSVFREMTTLANHLSLTFSVAFEHCKFHFNTASDFPILNIVRTSIEVSSSIFVRNNGTAISLHNSYLNVHGNVRFEHNSAEYGAALKFLDQSAVFLHKYSHIQFINNTALIGGALFVQEANVDINNIPLCIFQPTLPQNTRIEDFSRLLKVEFTNNTAIMDGDAIYGGSMSKCYTIMKYLYHGQAHKFNSLHIIENLVNMSGQTGPSWVSSRPQGVCFCHDNSETMPHYFCQTEHPVINTYPGARFNISVVTVGQLNGSTSGLIQASLKDQASFHKLISHNFGNYSNQCVTLTFTLLTNLSVATISLQPLSKYVIKFFSVDVSVQLFPCPLGFELLNAEGYKCECNSIFRYHIKSFYELGLGNPITCDINNVSLIVKSPNLWFGCLKFNNESTLSQCEEFGVSDDCEYCLRGHSNFTVTKFNNDLCPFGQTGILCGECKPGLSRTHDMTLSHTCEICSNKGLVLFILEFALSGAFLVLILAVLNITVTDGTINGLIFYANIFYGNHFFFPSDHHHQKPNQVFWVFIAWLNLHSGLKYCAYNGLDGYQYIWLNFGFVFYLLFIQGIIIFLSRRFVLFTRLFGRNVLKVLATVLFMSHSKLIYSCCCTFWFDYIYYFSSINATAPEYKIVWHFDGNIPYLGFKHALLFVVALLCSIFVLFFMLSLLFIQCLQRWNHCWCLRWVERLRPFYEVFTGPCHDNYRFWPGFLYSLRSGLYAISMYLSSYEKQLRHVKLFLTSATCILIMTLACIFPHGVYKKWYLNILEFSFILNLCIISTIWGAHGKPSSNVLYSISVAMLTSFGILLYHVHLQIRDICGWKKCSRWISVCVQIFCKRRCDHDFVHS